MWVQQCTTPRSSQNASQNIYRSLRNWWKKNHWSKPEKINRLWYEPSVPISWSTSLCNNLIPPTVFISYCFCSTKITKMKNYIFMSVCILCMYVCICGHISRCEKGGRKKRKNKKINNKKSVNLCVYQFVYSWALLTGKVSGITSPPGPLPDLRLQESYKSSAEAANCTLAVLNSFSNHQ